MFKKLFDALQKGDTIQISVTKNDDTLSVSLSPIFKEDKEANLPPVTATGKPEELDEKLIDAFIEVAGQAKEILINTSALLAAAKEKEAEAKKKADDKKTSSNGKKESKPEAKKEDDTAKKEEEEKKRKEAQAKPLEDFSAQFEKAKTVDDDELMVQYYQKKANKILDDNKKLFTDDEIKELQDKFELLFEKFKEEEVEA